MSRTVPKDARTERKDYLTARQLAAILQVSESTVRRLAREGRIPVMRLTPRLIRFHLTAVRNALDATSRTHSKNNSNEPAIDDMQLSFDDLL